MSVNTVNAKFAFPLTSDSGNRRICHRAEREKIKIIAIVNRKARVGKTRPDSYGVEDYLALCKEILGRG